MQVRAAPNGKDDRMNAPELLRVVTLRKGKLKAAEFMIRPREKGLSLFAHGTKPNPVEVVEAVRAAGKQGDLAVAIISVKELCALGLSLVQTPGGTPVSEVNATHYEARLSFLRKLFLRLRGLSVHDYFNDHLSPRLCALAHVLD
jgi:hypothetical protein